MILFWCSFVVHLSARVVDSLFITGVPLLAALNPLPPIFFFFFFLYDVAALPLCGPIRHVRVASALYD
jgi:hypothetical protein